MSGLNSTLSNRKFPSFSFEITFFRSKSGWFINWFEGMSYRSWQKILKRTLHFLGKKRPHKKPFRKKKWNHRIYVRKKYEKQIKALREKQVEEITQVIQNQKTVDNKGVDNLELITMLKQFLERKNTPQHIEKTIPDYRNQESITYSKQSIITSALAIFLFRMASGNKYDNKSHDKDEKYSTTNMAKFIDAPKDRVPVIKTIEKFLKNLEEKNINDLMIAFFKDLQQSKFFKLHPQILPGDFFLLSADCVYTHTYDHPHHVDSDGNNDCPYCLNRVYNKGTENEKVKWLHSTLVFCFVFMGGLKIPVYRYPIHARQMIDLEDVSDHKHKQECELVALKVTLPMIREAFPKMKIVLLLDGLYANRTTIRLAKDKRCGYIIVRKDGCLPSLAKDCNGQAKLRNHRKNNVKKCQKVHQNWMIEQKYEWFNSVDLGTDLDETLKTNVLRFGETKVKDGEIKSYKCEWLFSWRLSAKTCEISALQARSRWEEEDLFNTLKNRGFNLKHDFSRDPRSLCNWQGLAFFAFGVFELFRFSETVKKKCDFPQSTLSEKLLTQLLGRPTSELFSTSHLSIRVQFRYNFVVSFPTSKKIPERKEKEEFREVQA